MIFAMLACNVARTEQQTGPGSVACWTTERWTGNESPYLRDRIHIEGDVDNSKDAVADVRRYKMRAELSPKDPLVVFDWAVAARESANFATTTELIRTDMQGVSAALAASPSPQTYEYARMRYLFGDWRSPELKELGLRLLARNQHDPYVLMCEAMSGRSNSQSVSMLHAAIRIKPSYSLLYMALGMVYVDWFEYDGGSIECGHKGIQALRQFISMPPYNLDDKKDALHYIGEVTSMLASGKRAYG
jgi:hypothetical protein